MLGETLCHSLDLFPELFGGVAFDAAESRRHQMTGIATKKCVCVKINEKSTVVRCYDKIAWGDANT
jgi:hypothetical protein